MALTLQGGGVLCCIGMGRRFVVQRRTLFSPQATYLVMSFLFLAGWVTLQTNITYTHLP